MSHAAVSPRAHDLLTRIDAWAARSAVRAVLVRVGVTVAGPLLVLAGLAMLVLPGPGLVVIALGLALLAVEYEWARRVLALLGRGLSRAREAAVPRRGTRGRRVAGVLGAGAFLVATGALTTAVTALVGTQTFL